MASPLTRGLLTNTPKSKDTMIVSIFPTERELNILTDRTRYMVWAPLNFSITFCDGASPSARKLAPIKSGGSGFYNSSNALRSRTWWDMSSAKVKNLVNEKGCRPTSRRRS